MTRERLALRFTGIRLLMVRVHETYREDMTPDEVYDIVRWAWTTSLERAQQVEFLVGVVEGRIVGAYRITKCDRVENMSMPERIKKDPENGDSADRPRIAFEGVPVSPEIQNAFGNITIGDWFSPQNHPSPFAYINC